MSENDNTENNTDTITANILKIAQKHEIEGIENEVFLKDIEQLLNKELVKRVAIKEKYMSHHIRNTGCAFIAITASCALVILFNYILPILFSLLAPTNTKLDPVDLPWGFWYTLLAIIAVWIITFTIWTQRNKSESTAKKLRQ